MVYQSKADSFTRFLCVQAHRAMEVSARRGRLQTEDLLYLIRNVRVGFPLFETVLFSLPTELPNGVFAFFFPQDEKKIQRVNELLDMNVQLKEARKNFDLNDTTNVP